MLEELGFGFLHPLEPLVPFTLTVPGSALNIVQKPKWMRRGFHRESFFFLFLTLGLFLTPFFSTT